ncbi:MAG: hypothetical protein PSV35_07310 [bacterium]|nr:hypothetical protein [bacterium]
MLRSTTLYKQVLIKNAHKISAQNPSLQHKLKDTSPSIAPDQHPLSLNNETNPVNCDKFANTDDLFPKPPNYVPPLNLNTYKIRSQRLSFITPPSSPRSIIYNTINEANEILSKHDSQNFNIYKKIFKTILKNKDSFEANLVFLSIELEADIDKQPVACCSFFSSDKNNKWINEEQSKTLTHQFINAILNITCLDDEHTANQFKECVKKLLEMNTKNFENK